MRSLPFAIAMLLATATGRAQDAMTVETVARVKEATTYIRAIGDADDDGPAGSGSGFLVGVAGTTGYVVTNAHVISGSRRDGPARGRPAAEVFFRSGTKAEARAVAEAVAVDPGRDLALLKVANVAHLPAPIAIDASAAPFETMTVYIFGFPFGEQLAEGDGNPPVNVGRGQVSSLRRDAADQLTSVLLDGALNPGNSGGPVVDARGRLVGVAKATIRGANIGFAIAVPEVLTMLGGRAEEPAFALASADDGAAVLRVEVPLVDPLGRIGSARLLHARRAATAPNEDGHAGPDRAPETAIAPLRGAETLPMTIEKGRATGSLRAPLDGRDVVLSSQVAYVDGSGRTVYMRPARCLLGMAGADRGHRGPTFWGQVIDPDGDCGLRLEAGGLICDVPGALHDLNIDIGKTNAPRVVQVVEGDFVATVKVAGRFEPGPVRTGPRSVPYNGGGLLAWSDEGDYIRLERGAMHRNDRVLGLVIFEGREQGTRAAVHNKGRLDPHEDRWLRLERRGGRFSGSISADGRDWEALEPIEAEWPARLKVGLYAINGCTDPISVRFEDVHFTEGKATTRAKGKRR